MWLYILLVVIELVLLSVVSRQLTQYTFLFLYRIVRSRSVAITILTVLLFPGTVIHELSHLFTAEVLGVHTGKLTLAPESIEGEDIQSGSVAIAKTGPLRRTLIGIAPFFNGVIALTALSWWLSTIINTQQHILINQTVSIVLIFYLILTISNTMFSSKEDMVGVIPFAITLALLVGAGYIAGFRITFPVAFIQSVQTVLVSAAGYLGIVLAINMVCFALFSLTVLFHKKQ